MNQPVSQTRTLRIMITALGGEGGGVLMNWIVAAARSAGRVVQATSVPGVAQRTGATSYYIELLGADETPKSSALALIPMAGRVDVVIASELVEAARAMERGFVSPALTTLIASTNRVYATAEKIEMGDGRYDQSRITKAARELAKTAHLLDLAGLAEQHGTFISATMFGALAGSGALPWPIEVSRAVLGEGKAATRSLAGFDAAAEKVAQQSPTDDNASPKIEPPNQPTTAPELPARSDFSDGVSNELKEIVAHGFVRVVDFQDQAYGNQFVDRTNRLRQAAMLDDPMSVHALGESVKRLALWMAYEDIARVADLKTRPERFAKIAKEVQLEPGNLLRVTEYLKPGAQEIADIMPAGFGKWMMRYIARGRSFPILGRGIYLRSSGIIGFTLLRLLAKFRHIRRRSLRFGEEQHAIEEWLSAMTTSLQRNSAFAAALSELPRVLKGYSDTQARGQKAYTAIFRQLVQPAVSSGREAETATALRQAIAAALADPDHKALDKILETHRFEPPDAASLSPKEGQHTGTANAH
jgi:indolepyruvate ferredoxin oxidoreductase, beta subunit